MRCILLCPTWGQVGELKPRKVELLELTSWKGAEPSSWWSNFVVRRNGELWPLPNRQGWGNERGWAVVLVAMVQ
jgi:hypothetical protein